MHFESPSAGYISLLGLYKDLRVTSHQTQLMFRYLMMGFLNIPGLCSLLVCTFISLQGLRYFIGSCK